jgi:hypothetical protein
MRRPALRPLLAAALAAVSMPASGEALADRTERMPFHECLSLIAEVAGEFGTGALHVQRSADLSSARIKVADGEVTLVCRRTDQTVTLAGTTDRDDGPSLVSAAGRSHTSSR